MFAGEINGVDCPSPLTTKVLSSWLRNLQIDRRAKMTMRRALQGSTVRVVLDATPHVVRVIDHIQLNLVRSDHSRYDLV